VTVAIPSEAVSRDRDSHVCYVIGTSGIERRDITVGGSTADLVEVTDGLKEGESVALNSARIVEGPASRAGAASPDEPDSAELAGLP
jgi:hypothetical protein